MRSKYSGSEKPLTRDAMVALLAAADLLGLQLGLDHIERAGGDAGDQAAPRASWERAGRKSMIKIASGGSRAHDIPIMLFVLGGICRARRPRGGRGREGSQEDQKLGGGYRSKECADIRRVGFRARQSRPQSAELSAPSDYVTYSMVLAPRHILTDILRHRH